MKKLTLSLCLLAASLLASCSSTRSVIVRYNDNVTDTLRTDYNHYRVGKLEYIAECSCDGTVLGYTHSSRP